MICYSNIITVVWSVGFDEVSCQLLALISNFMTLYPHPTFNLGDFHVTPIVYEHQMVVNKETGKHPIFISPVLIHNRKYTTYYYLASQLETLCPNLPVGTDGEAFLSVFPNSTHLLCSEIILQGNCGSTKLIMGY